MKLLTLQLHEVSGTECCGLCRQVIIPAGGLQLQSEQEGVICGDCARPHAPALVALLDLARTAERVGRISQHQTVFPPLTALLDLARAAEQFLHARPPTLKRVA